jgi:S-adenosylhomocysteine hydrolase
MRRYHQRSFGRLGGVNQDGRSGEERVQREFEGMNDSIPSSMPILEEFVARHKSSLPLKGVTALLIQHQLGNHYLQAKALLELGLDPQKLIWVDVPYTSNGAVRAALEHCGVPRGAFRVHDYKVLVPYAPYQLRRVQSVVRELLADPPESLLVLDDGAYFLEAMCTIKPRFPKVVVVEQTTRGLIKIEQNATLLRYAQGVTIVNVARSRPKLTLEPPFIGRAVCDALLRGIAKHSKGSLPGPALVLGYGTIGRRVAESLVKCLGFSPGMLYIHDPDAAR